MQVQCPFIVEELDFKDAQRNFADFILDQTDEFGQQVALVDEDTGAAFRFGELRPSVARCARRLRELGVGGGSRVALVAGSCAGCCLVHLAAAQIGCRLVGVNAHLSTDEVWHQIDATECTHAIFEAQFAAKMEDVRRKVIVRAGRTRVLRRLDEVLGEARLSRLTKRESKSIIHLPAGKEVEPDAETASVTSASTVVVQREHGDQHQQHKADEHDHQNDVLHYRRPSPVRQHADEAQNRHAPRHQPDEPEHQHQQHEEHEPHPQHYLVLHTSGTVGSSKPVEVGHRQLIANLAQLAQPVYGPPARGDRFLLPLNVHHLFGFLSLYHALRHGATVVLLGRFTNKALLKALVERQVNGAHLTPPMVHFLANDLSLETVNLRPHLRFIVVGGASLDARVARRCKERLGVRSLRQVYVVSELGGVCTSSAFSIDAMDTVGMPLPGTVIKVVQFDKKSLCGPKQVGHIMVKPVFPSCTVYKKSNAEYVESDGFTKTGDAGFYDERGCIYVVDRMKEIIKFRGTVICPSDVECNMRTHPGVEDCAVVGRQNHSVGEAPAAFVVKKSSHTLLSTADVRQHISGKIPQFKELRGGVFFVNEIPRTLSGSVLRRQLRQQWDRERLTSRENATNGNAVKEAEKDRDKSRRSSVAVSRQNTSQSLRSGASRGAAKPSGARTRLRPQDSLDSTRSAPVPDQQRKCGAPSGPEPPASCKSPSAGRVRAAETVRLAQK